MSTWWQKISYLKFTKWAKTRAKYFFTFLDLATHEKCFLKPSCFLKGMNLFVEEESLNLLTEVNKSVKFLYTNIIQESKFQAMNISIDLITKHFFLFINFFENVYMCGMKILLTYLNSHSNRNWKTRHEYFFTQYQENIRYDFVD